QQKQPSNVGCAIFLFLYIPSDFPPGFYLRFIFLWRLPDAAAEKRHAWISSTERYGVNSKTTKQSLLNYASFSNIHGHAVTCKIRISNALSFAKSRRGDKERGRNAAPGKRRMGWCRMKLLSLF
ncbi:hypothetical protein, partial [Serratia marcescens]|uniref:hypothetical protein n=1 Tax=Serratia marcescens TaxID=615 RepID=UPI001F153E40